MRLLIVGLVAFVICGSTVKSSSTESNEDELSKRIDSANAVLDEASIKRDYETIASFYTTDVIILPNHEPIIIGREAFIENEKATEKAGIKILKIESTITRVSREGNLIHEIGSYTVQLQIPGPPYPITDTGKYLVIWEVQSDESLKIKLEMWNNDEMPEY